MNVRGGELYENNNFNFIVFGNNMLMFLRKQLK